MTIARLFGTDGMRGPLDSFLLAPENICQLGRVLGSLVKAKMSRSAVMKARESLILMLGNPIVFAQGLVFVANPKTHNGCYGNFYSG